MELFCFSFLQFKYVVMNFSSRENVHNVRHLLLHSFKWKHLKEYFLYPKTTPARVFLINATDYDFFGAELPKVSTHIQTSMTEVIDICFGYSNTLSNHPPGHIVQNPTTVQISSRRADSSVGDASTFFPIFLPTVMASRFCLLFSFDLLLILCHPFHNPH